MALPLHNALGLCLGSACKHFEAEIVSLSCALCILYHKISLKFLSLWCQIPTEKQQKSTSLTPGELGLFLMLQ